MRYPPVLAFAASLLASACVPGGPIYLGPPLVTLEGQVYSFEERVPLPGTEVCVFGADTVCVESDREGRFKVQLKESQVGTESSVTVRFRTPGLQPAIAEVKELTPGQATTVNCAISNRFTVSRRPNACLPTPER
ncbi:MAG: hypothetical protein GTN62_14540 [Gemmatimonadales bacterium]|nr:hypothetical protein [Gemmatimonadales bacterium]NIN13303.1 hypothetical protein [Gemmatimonadales bacterium]NIN51306.1 hypothetical protein [Gemmatimonadales bacterium]NIP08770.1 hypothetical protein [Gemmatimonadales bacterium]NIQ99764.1 hypothetical protein [Gemmatimonadales bacterium]